MHNMVPIIEIHNTEKKIASIIRIIFISITDFSTLKHIKIINSYLRFFFFLQYSNVYATVSFDLFLQIKKLPKNP